MKKINLKILPILGIFLLILTINQEVKCQEASKETKTFINSTLKIILESLFEEEGKDNAAIKNKKAEIAVTETELGRLRREKITANLTYTSAVNNEKSKSQLISDYTREGFGINDNIRIAQYKSAVTARQEAEDIFRNVLEMEMAKERALTEQRLQLIQIIQTAQSRNQTRMQTLSTLKTTVERFWENSSEENQTVLEEKINIISCQRNLVGNVLFRATGGDGALIYFQTIHSRDRGEEPKSINNPTVTREDLCYGRYYMWSVRNQQITSDKNKDYRVNPGEQTIILVEQP